MLAAYRIVALSTENRALRDELAVARQNIEILKPLALAERTRRALAREKLKGSFEPAVLDKLFPPEPVVWTCSRDRERWSAILK